MYAPWLRSTTLAVAVASALGVGCAHDQSREADAARDREAEALNSRVSRLERRLSDMDAKLTLLTDRLEADRTASRGPEPPRPSLDLAEPAPVEERAAPTLQAESAPEPPVDDDAGFDDPHLALAADAFDDDDGDEEPAGEPLVIDDKALARFSLEGRKGAGAVAKRQPARAPAPAVSARASGMPRRGAKAIYEWGLARVRAGDCAGAFGAFDAVLERYPRHGLADNALYWTGHCHQRGGAHLVALEVWGSLPARFPKSAKIPDALFGMAESHRALGDRGAAKLLLHQLLERYPDAEKADAARAGLKALESAS